MENFNENKLEIESLEEILQELLDKSEKFLGYRSTDIPIVTQNLFLLNDDIANDLANDILDIRDDIIKTEELYLKDVVDDDPFTTLYDEDNEF